MFIDGPRGIGKTAVLNECARSATERGFKVASARARAGERASPGFALWSAILRCAPGMTRRRDSRELIANFLSMAPVALVLDDAHLADELSLRVFAELAERIGSHRALMVVGAATHLMEAGAMAVWSDLSGREFATTIRLAPFDDAKSIEMIRTALPDADRRFCAEFVELTGGNPFLVSELAAWIGANRIEPVAGAARLALEPVPPLSIREFVRRQLADVGTDASALAAAIAISDRPLDLEQAATLTGFDRARSIRAAEALLDNRVIAPGEELSFAATLTARCIRADTPDALAADLHRRMADLVVAGGVRDASSTQHLLLAPPTGNPEVVDRLVELADGEVAGGNPGQARALIRRALAEQADDSSSQPHLVARLGLVDLLEGRPASTPTLATAVAALDATRDRADALLKLGVSQVAGGAPRAASLSFDAARDLVGDDDPLQARAAVSGLLTRLLVPEARDAAARRIESLTDSDDAATDPHRAQLLMARAWQGLCQGDPRSEVTRLADRALSLVEPDQPSIDGYFYAAAAILFATLDDFGRAHRICDDCANEARSRGSRLAERSIELARAVTLLHQGRLVEAGNLARALLDGEDGAQALGAAEASAILASALHEQGMHDETEQIIQTALSSAPTDELRGLLLLEVSARVWLERGDLAQALRAITEAETLGNALGVANPALFAWQPTGARCYEAVGQSRRAHALAEDALEVAESFGMPRAIALALRTKAAIEGPPAEIDLLKEALEVIEGSEAALERAKVLLCYGEALHRAGNDEVARSPLREGIGLADRLGATSISRRGLSTLRAAGGRPRRTRMAGPEALTPAERHVVDLAAAGATNREIAEALVITRKTVEWHLKKAFAKLEVRSRHQLRGVMDRERPVWVQS